MQLIFFKKHTKTQKHLKLTQKQISEMISSFRGRKQGSKNKIRRDLDRERVQRRSRVNPRKDITEAEFAVMKERLKYRSALDAANEPVCGVLRSVSSFLRVAKMETFENSRKGSSPVWDDGMISQLVAKIEQEPTITIRQMIEWSAEKGFPSVSVSTIHQYLDMKMITYKVGRVIPLARNSEHVLTSRHEYATWLSSNFGLHQIYIDECGFNLWTAPKHGRAPSGKTPHVIVSSQQGRNQTLILAISSRASVVHYEIINGSADSSKFNVFFEGLQRKVSDLSQKTVSILDNCRIHSQSELGQRLSPGHDLKFLPPYSPFFNPIENCFNWIKQRVKQCLK